MHNHDNCTGATRSHPGSSHTADTVDDGVEMTAQEEQRATGQVWLRQRFCDILKTFCKAYSEVMR